MSIICSSATDFTCSILTRSVNVTARLERVKLFHVDVAPPRIEVIRRGVNPMVIVERVGNAIICHCKIPVLLWCRWCWCEHCNVRLCLFCLDCSFSNSIGIFIAGWGTFYTVPKCRCTCDEFFGPV